MIDIKEIEKLASLSRIDLSQSEKEKLAHESSEILNYIDQIKEVTETVGAAGPAHQSVKVRNIYREDKVKHQPEEFTDDLAKNFPQKSGHFLKVKKIL